jgi:hypothetical protein
MAYDVTALPAYTSQQSKVFITKSILGAATIALLTQFGAFDPNAKGSEAIQLLDTDVIIQDGSTCGRNPMGGAVLSQAKLTVKELKVNQDYCVKELVTTWAVEELKRTMKGLPYTDALFLEDIGDLNSKKVALKLEQMIWQGDTTVVDTSLKQINGFIKQIKAGAYINLNPTAALNGASTMVAKMRAADALMPIQISAAEDFRILIGQDQEKVYLAELADKNLFVPPGTNTIFGTNTKYEALPGLNGLNTIVAAKVSRLRAGGEMTAAKFEKYYSPETKKTYFDSEFSLGVVPVYIEEIGLGYWPNA